MNALVRLPEGADAAAMWKRLKREMEDSGVMGLIMRRESRLYAGSSPGQRRRQKRREVARRHAKQTARRRRGRPG